MEKSQAVGALHFAELAVRYEYDTPQRVSLAGIIRL